MNVLEENMVELCQDLRVGKDFLIRLQITRDKTKSRPVALSSTKKSNQQQRGKQQYRRKYLHTIHLKKWKKNGCGSLKSYNKRSVSFTSEYVSKDVKLVC